MTCDTCGHDVSKSYATHPAPMMMPCPECEQFRPVRDIEREPPTVRGVWGAIKGVFS